MEGEKQDRPAGAPHSEATGKKMNFTFAALGKTSAIDADEDAREIDRVDVNWAARKACSALKITGSIINALVVHPGSAGTEAEISQATRALIDRAGALTNAALGLVGVAPGSRNFAGHKNRMLQQAADVVGTQWRLEHGAGAKQMTVDQISSIYHAVLQNNGLRNHFFTC